MKIAAVQFAPEFGNVSANLQRIAELVRQSEADLYVLPELGTTGYQFLDREEAISLAEAIPGGPTVRYLEALARKLGAQIVASLAERAGDRLFISAAVIGPTGLVGVYRKTHLFRREKELFSPGDTGFQVFAVGPARIGVLICFDWIFPEAARCLALQGAEVIAQPANLVLPWCQQAMVIRSLENRVFTVVANRCGEECRLPGEPVVFTGRSQIVSPQGTILAALGPTDEGLALAECDLALARDKHATPENDLVADRRPELYRALGANSIASSGPGRRPSKR